MDSIARPPVWSLNLGVCARGLVVAALALFVMAVAVNFVSLRQIRFSRLGTVCFGMGCAALLCSMGVLAWLFAARRFEFAYVWQHCDSSTPLQYRIAGVWAGQEGSFLLWACSAAAFGLATMRGTGPYRRWYLVVYGAFLAALAGIVCFESPFALNLLNGRPAMPGEGVGLAPTLLNFWVTVHPPVIFLGFGALTVPFAYAFAALATGDMKSWTGFVRPWAILATALVGLGLCMGGFWAYETLGWGGFWMWDPVENVSFVPWVLCAALVHGLPVQIVKGRWVASNLLLAALPFLAFVYGTYLTRSGVLGAASVHAFSAMQRTAFGILLTLLFGGGGLFLALWVWRVCGLAGGGEEPPIGGLHREGVLRWGSYLLVFIAVLTLIGMSFPAVLTWRGQKAVSVEEGLYHEVLVWFFVPAMLVLAAAPFIGWRGLGLRAFLWRIYNVLCLTFGLVGLIMLLLLRTRLGDSLGLDSTLGFLGSRHVAAFPWVLFLVGLCLFVFVGAVWRTVESARSGPGAYVALLSHAGVATLMAGLIVSRAFDTKAVALVEEGGRGSAVIVIEDRAPGDPLRNAVPAGGLSLSYVGQTGKPNDRDNRVVFDVQSGGERFRIYPGLYYRENGEGELQAVVWPYIRRFPLHDLYFSIQAPEVDASDPIQLKPGDSATIGGYRLKYLRIMQPREFGKDELRVGVLFKVQTPAGAFTLAPQLQDSGAGMRSRPALLSLDYELALEGIDPMDESVRVKLRHVHPVYRVEVLYKPLTIFVWAGTALLTLAGLLAAWVRRPRAGIGED